MKPYHYKQLTLNLPWHLLKPVPLSGLWRRLPLSKRSEKFTFVLRVASVGLIRHHCFSLESSWGGGGGGTSERLQ